MIDDHCQHSPTKSEQWERNLEAKYHTVLLRKEDEHKFSFELTVTKQLQLRHRISVILKLAIPEQERKARVVRIASKHYS